MMQEAASQGSGTSAAEVQQGRLFITGLSPLITSDQVNTAFGRYGEHFGVVLTDSHHLPFPSKAGNVTFRSALDAAAALKGSNGAVVLEIPIQVTWANAQLETTTAWQGAQLAPQHQLQPTPQQLQQVRQSHGPSASTSSVPSIQQPVGVSGSLLNGEPLLPEIFVADFPTSFDEAGLMGIFASFPSVRSARIMRDKTSGKCRGYGFVAFADLPAAQRSIATMHGEIVCGKAIRVGRAETKPAGAASSSPAATGRGNTRSMGMPPTAGAASGPLLSYETIRLSSDPTNTTIYFGELPHSVNDDKLTLIVAEFGRVIQIRIQRPPPTPDGVLPRPFAFVRLDTHDGASKAIHAAGGKYIDGHRIKSGWSKDKVNPDASPRRNPSSPAVANGAGPAHSLQQLHAPPPPPYQVPPYLAQPQLAPLPYQVPPQAQPHYQVPLHQAQPHQYGGGAAYNMAPPVAYGAATVPFNSYPAPVQAPMPMGFPPPFRAGAVPPHAAPAVPVGPQQMPMQPGFRFP